MSSTNRFLDRGMSFIRGMGGGSTEEAAGTPPSSGRSRGRSGAPTPSPKRRSSATVDSLSRDELLDLCVKLKKRLRALDSKHKEVGVLVGVRCSVVGCHGPFSAHRTRYVV